MPESKPNRILRAGAVVDRTGLSRATVYRYMHAGAFPASVRLGPGTVGWLESDVNSWIESRELADTAA